MTPRQAEVLSLIAQGMSNKLIARALGISHETVRQHATRLYKQIGVRNRKQAAVAYSRRQDAV